MNNKSTSRGRELYKRYIKIIKSITFIINLFPKSIRVLLWKLTDLLPDKLGAGIRYCILRTLVNSCGDNVYIGRDVEVIAWEKLTLGNNVSIHKGCYIDAKGGICISNDVSIAHYTSLISFEHTWMNYSLPIRDNKVIYKSILIDSDVWIGAGCRILAGVKIEERSIIAAGAVVKKDVKHNTIVGGVPAKVIKVLGDDII
ncbi:acyltransferase [Priestia megaterium]